VTFGRELLQPKQQTTNTQQTAAPKKHHKKTASTTATPGGRRLLNGTWGCYYHQHCGTNPQGYCHKISACLAGAD